MKRKISGARSHHWEQLSTDKLLDQRICDLDVEVSGTFVEKCILRLRNELLSRGLIHFNPKVFVGDEWFTPDGASAIAVPFFVLDKRLAQLERDIIGHVEGGTPQSCMKLLRHEAGHCFEHAYQLSSKREWQKLFGSPKQTYNPERYHANPKSRDYVVHIEGCYAQAHPFEDFAETFAVWLMPNSNWRQEYRHWPRALAKLEYVDRIVSKLADDLPVVHGGLVMSRASRLKSTLRRYYAKRLKEKSLDSHLVSQPKKDTRLEGAKRLF